jgi:hypothetical protein
MRVHAKHNAPIASANSCSLPPTISLPLCLSRDGFRELVKPAGRTPTRSRDEYDSLGRRDDGSSPILNHRAVYIPLSLLGIRAHLSTIEFMLYYICHIWEVHLSSSTSSSFSSPSRLSSLRVSLSPFTRDRSY